MASVLSSVSQTAHSLAASLLSNAQIKPGSNIPSVNLKVESPEQEAPLVLKGKNIIVGVPGAFTPPCSSHVPGYVEKYNEFKAKGVNEIYVVAVNDFFVMQAWKKSLASQGTPIHFIADDTGSFTGSIGMLFDASGLLGAPRSKRYVLVTNDDKVETVSVEKEAPQITTTSADVILALL